jgi:hypothetical protein
MEKLEDMKQFVGQEIGLKISTLRETYIGNLDDGEERSENALGVDERSCILWNIYQSSLNYGTITHWNPQFIQGNQEGADVLIPFHYWYGNTLYLRNYAENFHYHIDEVVLPSGDQLRMGPISASQTYDGVQKVRPFDHYTEEDAARMQTYPRLAEFGCLYVPERRSITGNLEKLLAHTKPLW